MAQTVILTPRGLGPSFPLELIAAGLSLAALPFAIYPDRLEIADGTPDAVRMQVAAVVAAHDPTKVPAPAFDLAAYIAAAHAALRDGGVTIGGMRIKTDAESRGLIDGAYALSTAQPGTAIDFKAASGWVTVDSATMQTIAVAVGKWVQACYSAYRKLDEGRMAGTVTSTAQVDAAFAAVTLAA